MSKHNDIKALIATAALTILLMLSGCKTTEYIPVETVRTEYKTRTDTIRDSIMHEVYVKEYLKGDTQYIDRTEYLYKDRWHTRTDTVIKTDSVQVPYPVPEEMTVMEKIQTGSWWWMLVAMIAMGMIIYVQRQRK